MSASIAGKFNLVQGDNPTILFLFRDEENRAYDLTGASILFNLLIAGALVSITGTVTNGPTGEATMILSTAQSNAFLVVDEETEVLLVSVDGVATLAGVPVTFEFDDCLAVHKKVQV